MTHQAAAATAQKVAMMEKMVMVMRGQIQAAAVKDMV